MALLNSLFAGVSGLRNHQSMMDVIGNNISNVNTIGFKGSRVTFSDTFNQFVKAGTNPTTDTGGTNSFQVGLGSKVNSIDRNWNQGTFENTGINTDLALQGQGMFVMKSNGTTYYTRAGALTFDAKGNLVSPQNGAVVQGKVASSDGVIPPGNNLEDIKIDTNMKLPAIATTNISWGGNLKSNSSLTRSENVLIKGNLNSNMVVGDTITRSTTVYNDYGDPYTLNITYTKTAAADPTATPPSYGQFSMNYDVLDANNTSIFAAPPATIPNLNFINDGSGNIVLDAASQTASKFAVNDATTGLSFDVDATAITDNQSTSTVGVSADNNRTPNIVSGSVTVYDSLGTAHQVTLKFTKVGDNQWAWVASVPGQDTKSGKVASSAGTIIFNSDGTIDPTNIQPQNPTLSFDPNSGANTLNVALNLGSGFSGVTQTSASSVVSALLQDGSPSASLSNINIDQYGNIVGIFSNGSSKDLAQIMVATFNNLNGLISVGDNMYSAYANAGTPRIGALGEETGTTVQSGALEQSNVDLSQEFSKMIVAQRGFQANARVVTTADSLLQEITNLIR